MEITTGNNIPTKPVSFEEMVGELDGIQEHYFVKYLESAKLLDIKIHKLFVSQFELNQETIDERWDWYLYILNEMRELLKKDINDKDR